MPAIAVCANVFAEHVDCHLYNYNYYAVPDTAPQDFSIQALDSTSIFLSWGALPQEARNGLILGYLVTVTEVGAENATNISTTTSDTELLVEDLAPFTTYTCSVLAFTSVGSGPVSQLIDITTMEDGEPRTWCLCSLSS